MKEYRKEELRNYVIGNILFIITLSGKFNSLFDKDIKDAMNLIHLIFGSALLLSILYIYIFILDSMIPSSLKEIIAFFPINKPGTVVFEYIDSKKIGYRDDRFSVDEIRTEYKNIFTDINQKKHIIIKETNKKKRRTLIKELKKYQNTKWFDIYIKHNEDKAVFTTQKDFLLNRDMNVITISILVFYIIVALATNMISFNWSVIILLIVEFGATSIAAKSKSIRFVLTVISRDVHKELK